MAEEEQPEVVQAVRNRSEPKRHRFARPPLSFVNFAKSNTPSRSPISSSMREEASGSFWVVTSRKRAEANELGLKFWTLGRI